MTRKVRLKITTHNRETIKFSGFGARCATCKRDVQMITEGEAAGILGIDSRTLGRLMREGQLHGIQTVIGNLGVCKDSLFLR
jgi:hypothetical protein